MRIKELLITFSSSLVTVGELAELFDGHGLLLDVVLCEEARLAGYILLDGCRYHQVIYIVIWASRLPILWGHNLSGENWKSLFFCSLFVMLIINQQWNQCKHLINTILSTLQLPWMSIRTYFSQACFVCSLGLHVRDVASEVLEFLNSGVKGHDPPRTMVLGNSVWCHPKTQWYLLQKRQKV